MADNPGEGLHVICGLPNLFPSGTGAPLDGVGDG